MPGAYRVGCHAHESPISVVPALSTSCNAYFCYAFRSMIDDVEKYGSTYNAFETWKKYIVDMGYGYRLGVDMPGESRGFIPNSDFYGKIYGPRGWKGITVISVSIGQGEVLATPLQIANLGATIANRGYYFTPHVVKSVQDTYLGDNYTQPHYVGVDPSYYEMVVEGMRMSMVKGTCRIGEIPGIEACGKTGTAQNPHGDDHSAFMALPLAKIPVLPLLSMSRMPVGGYLRCAHRQSYDGKILNRRDCSFAQMARRAYAERQYDDTGGRERCRAGIMSGIRSTGTRSRFIFAGLLRLDEYLCGQFRLRCSIDHLQLRCPFGQAVACGYSFR